MSTRPSWLGGATRAPKPDPCPSLGLFSRGGKKEPQPDFSTNDQTERPILISLRLVADTARHLRNGLLDFCGLRLCQRILMPSDDIVPLCPKGLTIVCLRPPSRLAMPIEMNRCDFTQFSEARSVSQPSGRLCPSRPDLLRLVRTVRCPSRRARRLQRAPGRRRWRSLGAVTRRESSRYRRLRSAPSGHPRIRDQPNP
jgi:hypothetical protein